MGSSDDFLTDHVDYLGGDGPRVAVYIRTSKKGQSQFSIGGQTDDVNSLIKERKPSIIYWFFDEGKSSKSDRDFDKLKINKILSLKRAGEVDELWVSIFDRMGRVSRPMAHFYLDFSEEGGIIRTTERVYGRDDLADFVRDADAAEKANKIRVKAVKNGTIRSFRLKHWNKRGTPLGYVRKDKWLQKRPEFDPWGKKMIAIFHETKCLQIVCDRLANCGGLLDKPLTRKQARSFFSDRLYIGMPERFGVPVPDEALWFYDEKTRQTNLEILAEIDQKWKPKRMGPIEKLAISKPMTLLQMLEDHEIELTHVGCGGKVRKNGTTTDEGPEQQLLSCKKCPTWWRLPPLRYEQSKDKTENSMGGLNFETKSSLINMRNTLKRDVSSVPMHDKLAKSQIPVSQANYQSIDRDLLGQPVNKSLGNQEKKEFLKQNGTKANQITKKHQSCGREESERFSDELDKNKTMDDF